MRAGETDNAQICKEKEITILGEKPHKILSKSVNLLKMPLRVGKYEQKLNGFFYQMRKQKCELLLFFSTKVLYNYPILMAADYRG